MPLRLLTGCFPALKRKRMSNLIVFVTLMFLPSLSIATVANQTDWLENTPLYLFDPTKLDGLIENSEQPVQVSCNRSLQHFDSVTLKIVSADPDIASVSGEKVILCQCEALTTSNVSQFAVRGRFLGRTVINIETLNATQLTRSVNGLTLTVQVNASLPVVDYHVAVVREERFIDHLFIGIVMFMLTCANIGMGCKIDLAVIKEVLTKPIAPAIGFSCQYLIMPLTAFALVKVFGLTGGLALGYFASGCAPGGGVSNMYAYFLGGDVSLSVTMTLISITASLGMIPLWLFTLGKLLIDDDVRITIPFTNIMMILASYLIPVVIGLLIQRYCKRLSKVIIRALRPLFVVTILLMFTIGVWSNLYIFRLLRPLLILIGCLLPYIGFLLSGVVAFILRQPPPRILTIAIETAIQNTGLPIILMKFSLPQPDADLAVVGPVTVAMSMNPPFYIAVAVNELRRRCRRRQSQKQIETAATADEPVPLKAVSNSSVSGNEMISSDNGEDNKPST